MKRENIINLYIDGLETGNADFIEKALEFAGEDTELDRVFSEIEAEYAQEMPIKVSIDRRALKQLIAETVVGNRPEKLSVGFVLRTMKTKNQILDKDLVLFNSLKDNSQELPHKLGTNDVRELFLQLGVSVSRDFIQRFRQIAISLQMRSQPARFQSAAREGKKSDT